MKTYLISFLVDDPGGARSTVEVQYQVACALDIGITRQGESLGQPLARRLTCHSMQVEELSGVRQ